MCVRVRHAPDSTRQDAARIRARPGVQERRSLEDSRDSRRAELRGLTHAEKLSHFYRRLASCAAKKHFNCFPFSQSHKASSVPVYTNCHPFFCTQVKIIASFSFESAALCILHRFISVSRQSEEKSKMAAQLPDCLSHHEVSVSLVTQPLY